MIELKVICLRKSLVLRINLINGNLFENTDEISFRARSAKR